MIACDGNRPNTWLHRPACERAEKPCQLGAVHTWHKAADHTLIADGPFWGEADMHDRVVSTYSAAIDPLQTSVALASG
jgi:hypothetical protein